MRIALVITAFIFAATASGYAAPSTKAPINLSGNWLYRVSGRMQLTQSSKNVVMRLTWTPNKDRAPHYIVNAVLLGHSLDGTWRCLATKCQHQHGVFHARVSASGNQIVVSRTQDPGGSNTWNSTTFTRASSSTILSSRAGFPNLAGVWIYDNGQGTARISQTGPAVTMRLTDPQPTPKYLVIATFSGRNITGTWRCLLATCHYAHGRFHAVFNTHPDRIIISQTQDPGDVNAWNRTTLYRH